jgi:flagellar protein FlbT
MSLKVELKPGERVIVGDTVITNLEGSRVKILIRGPSPVLREKDVMMPEDADTVAKRVYGLVQSIYLAGAVEPQRAAIDALTAQILLHAPSTGTLIGQLAEHLDAEETYKALKTARALVDYEAKLMAAAAAP